MKRGLFKGKIKKHYYDGECFFELSYTSDSEDPNIINEHWNYHSKHKTGKIIFDSGYEISGLFLNDMPI